jgi:two-component system C4-dicarboxylate transport response regulator DctD
MNTITPGTPVLLIDDEAEIRKAWSETLALELYRPLPFGDGREALAVPDAGWPGVVVTDLRMPDVDGFQVLEAIRAIDPQLPVIIVTGHGDIPMAVRAVRAGAYDFVEKPADPEMLLSVVGRAAQMRALVLENRRLSEAGAQAYDIEAELLGNSGTMRRLRDRLRALAPADVNTVIYGETGTGKELVARALHQGGPRRQGPFVALNCGALPDTLIASELFGHEAGAFTGADRRRIGRLEQASGGTLFLDEIESMPLAHQTQLLRALQAQSIERLGGREEIAIDVRVVAAAKVDLEAASAEGAFRADLFYRIAVAEVSIPPLRQRAEDIPLLFMHFATRAAQRHGLARRDPGADLLERLGRMPWKGNVRELVNFAERFALGIETGTARPFADAGLERSLPERMDAFERSVLESALRECGGHVQHTAQRLGIPRKKLYLRMQRHGLDRLDFTSE